MSSIEQADIVAIFEKHVAAELAGDLKTTMDTMCDDPHILHVASMMGGVGHKDVQDFYRESLVGKFFPPDVKMKSISRTVGVTQLVEELIITFTHTAAMPWMLPDVAPTGRYVETAFVVIVGFRAGKVSHEHIYWDQASVLVQLGLLDPKGLPVSGTDAPRWLVNPERNKALVVHEEG